MDIFYLEESIHDANPNQTRGGGTNQWSFRYIWSMLHGQANKQVPQNFLPLYILYIVPCRLKIIIMINGWFIWEPFVPFLNSDWSACLLGNSLI